MPIWNAISRALSTLSALEAFVVAVAVAIMMVIGAAYAVYLLISSAFK